MDEVSLKRKFKGNGSRKTRNNSKKHEKGLSRLELLGFEFIFFCKLYIFAFVHAFVRIFELLFVQFVIRFFIEFQNPAKNTSVTSN